MSPSCFLRYPYSDLFSAQHHYCLKIKIHGSHPQHTCDRFSVLLWHWGRNGVATDHKVTFICNGDKGGEGGRKDAWRDGEKRGRRSNKSEGNVCVWREQDKGVKEMERAHVRACGCEDNGKREKSERKCLRIFFRANSPEKSDLEVVNCTLKSSPLCW